MSIEPRGRWRERERNHRSRKTIWGPWIVPIGRVEERKGWGFWSRWGRVMEGFFEANETLVEGLGIFCVMRLIGGELAEEKEREVWERICGGAGMGSVWRKRRW